MLFALRLFLASLKGFFTPQPDYSHVDPTPYLEAPHPIPPVQEADYVDDVDTPDTYTLIIKTQYIDDVPGPTHSSSHHSLSSAKAAADRFHTHADDDVLSYSNAILQNTCQETYTTTVRLVHIKHDHVVAGEWSTTTHYQ